MSPFYLRCNCESSSSFNCIHYWSLPCRSTNLGSHNGGWVTGFVTAHPPRVSTLIKIITKIAFILVFQFLVCSTTFQCYFCSRKHSIIHSVSHTKTCIGSRIMLADFMLYVAPTLYFSVVTIVGSV